MQSPALLPDESLSKKLITKGFWTYFFTLIIAPSGYLLRMWFSDAVSVAEVGIFYSVLSLVVMLSAYNDLGLTEAMMYFIPKFWINQEPTKARRVLLASFLMQMFTGVLIFILIYRGADRLAVHHFHQPASAGTIKILAAYFLGMNLLTLCITLFSSFQDTFSQGLTFAMQQLITLVFTLIFRSTASLSLLTYSWIRL